MRVSPNGGEPETILAIKNLPLDRRYCPVGERCYSRSQRDNLSGGSFDGCLRRMRIGFSPSALALAHRRTSSRSINNLASSVVGVCRPFKINQRTILVSVFERCRFDVLFLCAEATSTPVSFVLSIDDTTTSIGHTIRLIWMSAIPFIVLLRTSRSPVHRSTWKHGRAHCAMLRGDWTQEHVRGCRNKVLDVQVGILLCPLP
jgi:hypothetical protein